MLNIRWYSAMQGVAGNGKITLAFIHFLTYVYESFIIDCVKVTRDYWKNANNVLLLVFLSINRVIWLSSSININFDISVMQGVSGNGKTTIAFLHHTSSAQCMWCVQNVYNRLCVKVTCDYWKNANNVLLFVFLSSNRVICLSSSISKSLNWNDGLHN